VDERGKGGEKTKEGALLGWMDMMCTYHGVRGIASKGEVPADQVHTPLIFFFLNGHALSIAWVRCRISGMDRKLI
jgi:hypothetical protein